MNPEITKIIEQYLNNELSAADRQAFEQRLSGNEQLQQELDLQQLIREGAKRAAQRSLIQQTGSSYHFRKNLLTAAVVVAVAGVIALTTWLAIRNTKAESPILTEQQYSSLVSKLDTIAPMEHIEAEYFRLGAADTVVLSDNGVLLSVPEGAFLLNGKPYNGAKIVQWQEAVDASAIVKAGLSTMSGDRLLETQGMFGVQGFTVDGRKLEVNPKIGLYVQVPVDEVKAGMQLFEGKPGKNGVIDWQNPQPLEKIPVMADMKDLDFYPPGYEKELNNLKWKTAKKSRDSLYLSFEELDVVPEAQVVTATKQDNVPMHAVSSEAMAVDPVLQITEYRKRDYSGTMGLSRGDDIYDLNFDCEFTDNNHGRFIISGICGSQKMSSKDLIFVAKNPLVEMEMIDFESKLSGTINHIKVVYEVVLKSNEKITSEADFTFTYFDKLKKEYYKDDDFEMQFWYPDDYEKNNTVDADHIPPSSVLAFWKPKFNNTILATRDFEKRMKAIHATCSKEVLKQYTSNLDKPLYVIDEKVAAMGYPEFKAFAAERVGAVKLSDPHTKNLQAFYTKSIANLKEAARKDKDFLRKMEQSWDNKVTSERTQQSARKSGREATALNEEYELNLKNVCRQLGRTVGFQIHGGGTVYNIDKYVMDATVARESAVITDPSTGKTATITYNPFSVSVSNPEKYEKLFLYLFPHELNSFQRIDPKGALFDYNLNNAIQYDLAVVGMNEDGYYLFTKKSLNKGALGTVSLTKLSEAEFNKTIESLNSGRNSKPMKIKDELSWLSVERENYKVQRLRKEQAVFREKLRKIVFPCMSAFGQPGDGQGTEEDVSF